MKHRLQPVIFRETNRLKPVLHSLPVYVQSDPLDHPTT
jgi:hypothetical protein